MEAFHRSVYANSRLLQRELLCLFQPSNSRLISSQTIRLAEIQDCIISGCIRTSNFEEHRVIQGWSYSQRCNFRQKSSGWRLQTKASSSKCHFSVIIHGRHSWNSQIHWNEFLILITNLALFKLVHECNCIPSYTVVIRKSFEELSLLNSSIQVESSSQQPGKWESHSFESNDDSNSIANGNENFPINSNNLLKTFLVKSTGNRYFEIQCLNRRTSEAKLGESIICHHNSISLLQQLKLRALFKNQPFQFKIPDPFPISLLIGTDSSF